MNAKKDKNGMTASERKKCIEYLARKALRGTGVRWTPSIHDDMMQAGRIGAYLADKDYDRARGTWSNWAWWPIRHEVQMCFRLKKGEDRNAHCSFEYTKDENSSGLRSLLPAACPDPEESLETKEMQELVREGVSDLSDEREQCIIRRLYLEEVPPGDVAAEFDIGDEWVRQLRVKALKKLKKVLLRPIVLGHSISPLH